MQSVHIYSLEGNQDWHEEYLDTPVTYYITYTFPHYKYIGYIYLIGDSFLSFFFWNMKF